MGCLNPFNWSFNKLTLFYINVLQFLSLSMEFFGAVHIFWHLFSQRKYLDLHFSEWSYPGFLLATYVVGFVTIILCIIGIFRNIDQLILTNIIYTMMLIVPCYFSTINYLVHPWIPWTFGSFHVILGVIADTGALIFGIKAYREIKEAKKKSADYPRPNEHPLR